MKVLQRTLVCALALALWATVWAGMASAQAARRNWRQENAEIQARNAARIDKGGRIGLELVGEGAGKDRTTGPEALVDGNPNSWCVTWGTPVRYRIDLVAALPITQINFMCSKYNTAQTPKDIEIRLSDGTVIKRALEALWPASDNPYPRQTVEINKTIEWVEVTVLSVHEGPVLTEGKNAGKRTTYGGLGEIEVVTSADLAPYLEVPQLNAEAPVYVEGASPRNDYSQVKTTLPPAIPLGRFPGIYLTAEEIDAMVRTIRSGDRGKEMLDRLTAVCDGWLAEPVEMPDPTKPAQLTDRGDAPTQAHDALSKKVGWFGWAYQVTNDEKYAAKAREILVGYARLYPNDYKEHKGVNASDTGKIMAQRLSEAMWLLPLIQGYDMIHDAPCLSDDDRRLIEEDLIRHALTFINGKRSAADDVAARDKKNPDWRTADETGPRKTVGNWTNFYNAAYIQGGIVLKDQHWIDLGAANTRYNLHTGIGDDGMWGEGAIGYHLFGRHALVACLEALARKGIDLYGFEQCRFKNLFDSPLKYAYPDSTAPGIHDSGRTAVGGSWEAMAYDFAYLRYGDANYGRIVNDAMRQMMQSSACYFPTVIYEKLPEKPLEGLTSLIFDTLGYAILRGREGDSQTYLLMDYGPHGGVHGHPDKLNLILFADGDELAGEPQMYRYEDRRHGEWTRPTIAHWSVSVDSHSQAPTTGKLLAFADRGPIKVMRGQSGDAYAGVGLDRTVVQMPGYVADIYRCWSKGKRTFDYPLCFRGTLDALRGADPAALKPMGQAAELGYKHILALPPVETADAWTGVWSREAVTVAAGQEFAETVPDDDRRTHPASEVKAVVVGGPASTVFVGQVPGGRHQAVLRRQGTETVFAAVIDPFKAADVVARAESFDVTGPVPAYGLKVTRTDGGTDLILVRFDPQTGGKPAEASTGGNVTTNALVTVVRMKGDEVLDLGLIGGTDVTLAGGLKLRSGESSLKAESVGIHWAAGK